MQNFRTCLEQTRRKKTDVLYAFAGEILLPRHEIRQKIPVNQANIIRCCMATKQLLHGDKAIAASRQSNQQNSITLIT